MCHILCAGTQLEHGENLGARINGQPEPEHLLITTQPRPQFVQLEIGKLEMTEKVLMEALSVLPSASEPRGDGGLSVAEDPFSRGSIQSFGQRR